MNKFRIAYDAKRAFHNASGLGNYARDLIRAVTHTLPDSEIFLMDPEPGRDSSFSIPSEKVSRRGPQSWFAKKFPSLWRSKGMVKDLKEYNVNIYHGLTNEIPKGIEGTDIKSVVTIHDLIFERYPQWYNAIDRKIYRFKTKHAAKHADGVVAISQQTKDDLIEFYGIAEEKIKVIYQGCHPAFKQEPSVIFQQKLRKKFNLPERFVLNVGTIEPRKNAAVLAEAMASLPGIPLVLVGKPKPDYFESVKKVLSPQTPFIHLQGMSMQELAGIYQMADLFVYPSTFEGFGIPIIEALFSKTPVISTQGGCFSEAGGPNSLYVPSGDVKELRQAIGELWDDSARKEAMRNAGWEYAQRFRDDKIIYDIISVYEGLL